MSKMGQFVFQMQEDAMVMSKDAFIDEYGSQYVDIYDQVYNEFVGEPAGFEQQQALEEMQQQINDQIPF